MPSLRRGYVSASGELDEDEDTKRRSETGAANAECDYSPLQVNAVRAPGRNSKFVGFAWMPQPEGTKVVVRPRSAERRRLKASDKSSVRIRQRHKRCKCDKAEGG